MHPDVVSTPQESNAPDTMDSAESAQLRLALAEQTEHLDQLMARITHLMQRQAELRAALLDAHRLLAERDSEVQTQNTMVSQLTHERNQLRAAVDEAMKIIEVCDEVTREQERKKKAKKK